MLAHERLIQIEKEFSNEAKCILTIELDDESLKLVILLKDDTNLRVTEQWNGEVLERYSYYWLTSTNKLKIGWDNAPHHTHLETFPHHRHIKCKDNIQPSSETCLEHVLAFIRKREAKKTINLTS